MLLFQQMFRPRALRHNKWQVAPPARFDEPEKLTHIHPVILQVLYNRGINKARDINAFLNLHYLKSRDPFELADMEKAVNRIKKAAERDEIIAVYGDFDADGVSATVLLVEALRAAGIPRNKVIPYIPDRVDEGYGLNDEALVGLQKQGVSLVISVDCGIRSYREIQRAEELDLDMIITDHHSLGSKLPPAYAVINPKRSDSSYPERRLAGVGIAYKVAQALNTTLPVESKIDESRLLDLVALGTVADLVPLLGENRILVSEGLRTLNEGQRPGIRALIDVAGLEGRKISSESIAFMLGPRINAAGRLSHAYDAARLLISEDFVEAREFAQELDRLNVERQQLTRDQTVLAETLIRPKDPILFAADRGFISGVVGLVASRLADQYYRPAIVIEQGDDESRGSCRSIPGFHITEALDEVDDLLERHGGHAQAAGFTITNENLLVFRERITEIAAEKLDEQLLTPSLEIDAEVELADIDWALQEILEKLEPTGNANAQPIFVSRGVHVFNHRSVGRDGAHLQLWVGDSRTKLGCIAFRQGAWAGQLPDKVDIAYTIGVNEWNGRRDLQLVVQDINQASGMEKVTESK